MATPRSCGTTADRRPILRRPAAELLADHVRRHPHLLRTCGELYHPTVAILGIGGVWLGRVKLSELPSADAAVAAQWLGVSTLIPVHYRPGDPAPAQLAADVASADRPIRVVSLDIGDTWTAPLPVDGSDG